MAFRNTHDHYEFLSRYFAPSVASKYPESHGFRSEAQSVHASRTIMLADLTALLDAVPGNAPREAYRGAIQEDNVLGKKTASTRLWAFKKLRELYALDPEVPVFSELRARWSAGAEGRPLLALLAALARDSLLRASVPVVADSKPGTPVTRDDFRAAIVHARGDRFSEETIKAIVSHLYTSWTESGHLTGQRDRTRAAVAPTPAVTAYALALGYLIGARGARLFQTLFTSVLDAPLATLHEQAREGSRRGWLQYRGVEEIVEIDFPQLRNTTQPALFP